jgi:Big-like domain-containing protein
MKIKTYWGGLILTLFFLGLAGCGGSGGGGGGGVSGNPQGMIPVSGTLTSAEPAPSPATQGAAISKNMIATAGITVIATDETGNLTQTTTQDMGSFTLSLAPDHTYVISFFQQDQFLGVLVFKLNTAGEITTRAFHLSPGDGAIDLGQIACTAGVCSGNVNPLCELDEDHDGIVDCEDADDDNDGIKDENEADDNLDGINNDMDGNHENDQPMVGGCRVIRAEPFNGETGVALNSDVQIRFSGQLDPATVTSDTFHLSGPSGMVAAKIEAETESEDQGLLTELKLEPLADLEPETGYTLHVDGAIRCLDGSPLEKAVDVSFTTGTDHSD